jgi:hypothetical protein
MFVGTANVLFTAPPINATERRKELTSFVLAIGAIVFKQSRTARIELASPKRQLGILPLNDVPL